MGRPKKYNCLQDIFDALESGGMTLKNALSRRSKAKSRDKYGVRDMNVWLMWDGAIRLHLLFQAEKTRKEELTLNGMGSRKVKRAIQKFDYFYIDEVWTEKDIENEIKKRMDEIGFSCKIKVTKKEQWDGIDYEQD